MKHKDKVRMARRMRTHKELLEGVALFQSLAWETRKAAIAMRLHPPIYRWAPVQSERVGLWARFTAWIRSWLG